MIASVDVSIRRGKGRDGATALAAAAAVAASLLLLLMMDGEAEDEEDEDEGPPPTAPGTRGENLPGALGGGRDGCIVLGAVSKHVVSET